jgi:hypothetical protein
VATEHDVMAYFNQKALEGYEKYNSTRNKVKYAFVNQKTLFFLVEPEKNVPKHSGYCAYIISQKVEKAGMHPETF